MATTLRQLVGAVQIQLKQLGDDRQVPFPLITQWCGFFTNRYRYEKYKTTQSGNYLAIYTSIPVVVPTSSTNPDIVSGRKYIVFPATIFDYSNDDGVHYISYTDFDGACQPSFAGVKFTRTTPAKAKRLYMSTYETPTPDNPYFYRVGENVYLLGIENITVNYLEAGLITAFDPFYTGSLDDELDLGEEGFDYVIKNVLDLGRFMLLMPEDRLNDANEDLSGPAVPGQKLVSVNQQPIQTE